jgi:hypothetical protein
MKSSAFFVLPLCVAGAGAAPVDIEEPETPVIGISTNGAYMMIHISD